MMFANLAPPKPGEDDFSSGVQDDKKNKEDVAIVVDKEEEKEEETGGGGGDGAGKDKSQEYKDTTTLLNTTSTTTTTTPRPPLTPDQIMYRRIAVVSIGFVLFLAGIIILFKSLKTVPENEVGLKYKKYSKQLDDAAKSGGLFSGPPGFRFVKFPSTFLSVDIENTCVSRDGLRVYFQVTFQYQMTKENLYNAVLEYRDFYKWAEVVESAARSGIHHTCSEFQVTDFQRKRDILQDRMFENLRLKLEGDGSFVDGVFAKAVSLQLNFLQLPTEYMAAVTEKQSAEEDIDLAINQRKQEVTKAETGYLAAQEEAHRILNTAINEAEVLLMEAKLEAEETIFAFAQEAETIVDAKENLNFTTEGILAYMATQLIEDVDQLHVSTGEPAKLSRPNEL